MAKFVKFTDADVCNIEDWIPKDEYNPNNVVPWLINDHGFVLAVCFASDCSDAIDIAVDCNKLDDFACECTDESECDCHPLGNAGELFDLESINIVELPNVKMSFATLFFTEHDEK